eukprot:scaffold37927_cov208-Isochrysis_galbana.AAC.2
MPQAQLDVTWHHSGPLHSRPRCRSRPVSSSQPTGSRPPSRLCAVTVDEGAMAGARGRRLSNTPKRSTPPGILSATR